MAACSAALGAQVSWFGLRVLRSVARRAPGRASQGLSPGANAGPAAPQAPP